MSSTKIRPVDIAAEKENMVEVSARESCSPQRAVYETNMRKIRFRKIHSVKIVIDEVPAISAVFLIDFEPLSEYPPRRKPSLMVIQFLKTPDGQRPPSHVQAP